MADHASMPAVVADVCLVLEGTYPYVGGGVSTWVHDLIRFQPETSFHLVCLLPHSKAPAAVLEVPPNVVGMTHVNIQEPPAGAKRVSGRRRLFRQIAPLLIQIQEGGDLAPYCSADRGSCARRTEAGGDAQRAWGGLTLR